MCYGCYKEAGEPKIFSGLVMVAAAMAKEIDNYGAFHIVVDDMNIEDHHLEYCIEHAEATEAEIEFGRLMLTMDEDARMSALALADGMWSMSLKV
ncbi:hypothetical protein C8D77_101203 [Mesorhizobium loti]|uniref:Uncharacterized protein n=1 Tax=Rhizobium loti TaxID=381 RepID=A0A8E2WFJ8_RHILI|nr:hypothetical protein [Mesorhizobium loti]PWJ93524.1 hypothetical protein C8D77_101203 [Mesorhizobium loti]